MGLSKLHLLDLDDIFAYRTPRTVLIRDRKLGISRILILIALFIYVVIYEVILQKGYLLKEFPVGYQRVSVLQPEADETSLLPYCCQAEGCVEQAFGSRRGMLPCVVWNELTSVTPPSEEFSTFVSTRVSVTQHTPVPEYCVLNETVASTSGRCKSWDNTVESKQAYYVAKPDEATVLIVHAVYGKETDLILSSNRDMPKARLSNVDGDYIRNFCDDGSGSMDTQCSEDNGFGRVGDIMSVRELMSAAGVPDTSLDVKGEYSDDTLRYDGIVLIIVIDYAGTGFNKNAVKYSYKVKYVPGAEYKYVEVKDYYNGTHTFRQTWNRHGVRIILITAGWIGKFSFTEMLKTLVTGLALLAAAGTITDYIVMRLLPHSDVYRRYKNVRTVDFSDLPSGERALKEGKQLTWGGRHLTDEAFVYGELSDDEKEISDETRRNAEEDAGATAPDSAERKNGNNFFNKKANEIATV